MAGQRKTRREFEFVAVPSRKVNSCSVSLSCWRTSRKLNLMASAETVTAFGQFASYYIDLTLEASKDQKATRKCIFLPCTLLSLDKSALFVLVISTCDTLHQQALQNVSWAGPATGPRRVPSTVHEKYQESFQRVVSSFALPT
jgi:hypothetical protein